MSPLNKIGKSTAVKLLRTTLPSTSALGNFQTAAKSAAEPGTRNTDGRAALDNTSQNNRLNSATLQSSGSVQAVVAGKEKIINRHFTDEFYTENQTLLRNFASKIK